MTGAKAPTTPTGTDPDAGAGDRTDGSTDERAVADADTARTDERIRPDDEPHGDDRHVDEPDERPAGEPDPALAPTAVADTDAAPLDDTEDRPRGDGRHGSDGGDGGDGHVHGAASASALTTGPHRGAPEWSLVLVGSVVLVAAMVSVMRRLTDFWLPLDASRYVAEVEWLRGAREILPGIHPPAFPGLVWAYELVVDRWSAVLFAMVTAYVLFVVALYTLVRQWHRPAVAVAATSVAAVTPVLAEILGWGGGANLLGMAASLFVLAATEAWVRTGKRPWAVGLATGAAIAAHPLSGTVAVFFVGARAGWHVVTCWRAGRPSPADRRNGSAAGPAVDSTVADDIDDAVDALDRVDRELRDDRGRATGGARSLRLVRTSATTNIPGANDRVRSTEPVQLTLATGVVDPGLLRPVESSLEADRETIRPNESDGIDDTDGIDGIAGMGDDTHPGLDRRPHRMRRSRRRLSARTGPTHVIGWVLAIVASTPLVAASAYYYLGTKAPGQTGIGIPDLAVLLDILAWAGREHPIVLILHLVAIVTPLLLFGRRSHAAAAVLGVVLVLGTSALTGDASYQSRFVYLLPALIAIAVAEFGPTIARFTADRLRTPLRTTSIVMCGLLVLVIVQAAFHERLDTATRFYARVEHDDIVLIESLEGRTGITASSYWGANEGEPTNWFVNAAGVREAWSPIGPWLSTIPEEAAAGREMQRLFAGQVGIEDGRFQIAASGTATGYYELRVSVQVDDWYHSVFVIDPARTNWPFAVVDASARLDGDRILLTLSGVAERDRIELVAELTADGIRITADTSSRRQNDWHVVLSPAGAGWGLERLGGSLVRMDTTIGGARHEYAVGVGSDGAPARAVIYGPGQPVDFDILGADAIELTVGPLEGFLAHGEVTTFDEQRVADGLDVQQVMVWRNTGLAERFDTPCYAQFGAATHVVGFERVADCGAAVDGG